MAAPKDPESKDVALLCGPTEDGGGTRILRARKGRVEAGEVRPTRDGQPLSGGELVRLRPREGVPVLCDVEVLHEPAEAPDPTGRPARVATDRYRENWDRIFGAGEAPKAKKSPDRTLN
jgi:hypothetical protein